MIRKLEPLNSKQTIIIITIIFIVPRSGDPAPDRLKDGREVRESHETFELTECRGVCREESEERFDEV
jgi:hypothetical protein